MEKRYIPKVTPLFLVVAVLFVTTLVISNIIAIKIVQLELGVVSATLPAAIIIFPLSYILGDVLTEVYGYRAARSVIWLGFLCNLLAVLAIWGGQLLPSASFWEDQDAYKRILGLAPRILAASFTAYLIGEMVNSAILSKLKVITQGRWLWSRTIGSTIFAQGLDSLIFITLAFAGNIPSSVLMNLVITQWLAKVAYEAAATPLTYGVITFLKRKEGIDTYDRGISFNPIAIFK